MAKITPEEIKNLFALSRLPYDESKIASAQKDMEEILGYAGSLSRLDTSAAKEVHGGADVLNNFRKDALDAPDAAETEKIKSAFPRNEAGLNKVPTILGK
jgi:aspartyl/glutamyl-tRNA(Asn/Gln) amidotransferase C subunit